MMSELAPQKIALFPLSNGLYPDSVLQLNIFEVRYLHLMKECNKNKLPFGVVWLSDGAEIQVAGKEQVFFPSGTLANIQSVEQVQPTLLQVRAVGGLRFQVESSELGPFGVWYANVRYLAQDPTIEAPIKFAPLTDRLGQLIASAQQQGFAGRLPFDAPYRLDECGWIANRWAELLPMEPEGKIDLLNEMDPVVRLEKIMNQIEL
jgi:uncharacterized protein